MPSWSVHNKYCTGFDISIDVCNKVNKYIDSSTLHDIGRAIENQDFKDLETAQTFMKCCSDLYQRYGFEGVTAYILHHILDYLETHINNLGILTLDPCRPINLTIKFLENVGLRAKYSKELVSEIKDAILKSSEKIKEFIGRKDMRLELYRDLLNCDKLISKYINWIINRSLGLRLEHNRELRDKIISVLLKAKFSICNDVLKAVENCSTTQCINQIELLKLVTWESVDKIKEEILQILSKIESECKAR